MRRWLRLVQRIRLNQDYELIRLKEVVVEVRTHQYDSLRYSQEGTVVSFAEPEIIVQDVWLGDENGNEYDSIYCGQSGKLWFWAYCKFCYTNYVTIECYAGKDTGWENLIRRYPWYYIGCGSDCCYMNVGILVPYFGKKDDPRNGTVKAFLEKAGLDCEAEEVKVCGKIIYEN